MQELVGCHSDFMQELVVTVISFRSWLVCHSDFMQELVGCHSDFMQELVGLSQ